MLKRMLVIVGILSLAVGSTWAYFSTTADSNANVITAGTLAFGTPVDATWTSGNMVPGDTLSGNYSMDNAGTMAANHLEIATGNTGGGGDLQEVLAVTTILYGYDADDDGSVGDEDPGNVVDIISVITSGTAGPAGVVSAASQDADYSLSLETPFNGSSDVAQVDVNNDNVVTLKELADAGPIEVRAGDNNQGLAAGSKAAINATLSLPVGTDNAYQGKSNTLTWTYTLNQDTSQ